MIPESTLQQAWDHYLTEFNKEEDDNGNPLMICTNVCQWLRENYFPEAIIMGYHHDDNPTAIVGEAEGGHDFLILDNHIIDFWQKAIYDEFFPLSLPLPDAGRYYGEPDLWTPVPLAA